jgi:hypothetical protein
MNRPTFPVALSCCLFSLFAVASSLAAASDVVLQKAPPLTVRQAPAYPENLARYHFGADVKAAPQSVPLTKLELSSSQQDQNTSESALLCDDPTTGYQLLPGISSLAVSLANIENVESLGFLNAGAEGSFEVAVSNANLPASSPEWRKVGRGSMIEGPVALKIGPSEAKYLKVKFDLARTGRIAAFGVYATPALSDFTMPRPRKISFEESSPSFALVNFNFSDLHLKARGLYASSGNLEAISNMIDDQAATAYQFAPYDAEPTAVIDLGREHNLSRLSAIYAQQPGLLEFYVLATLPGQDSSELSAIQQVANSGQGAELPPTLKLTAQTWAGLKPVGSVTSDGQGRASVDFPEVAGRYLILKWHPAKTETNAFSIAQVAAFGPGKPSQDSATAQINDGKTGFDGKAIFDKESPGAGLGEPAAPGEGPPPGLPPVPPFTFIPQVPPTSP